MIGCMRQLISSDHETELESLSKLIPTIGAELEKEQRGQEVIKILSQFISAIIGFRHKIFKIRLKKRPSIFHRFDKCDTHESFIHV